VESAGISDGRWRFGLRVPMFEVNSLKESIDCDSQG